MVSFKENIEIQDLHSLKNDGEGMKASVLIKTGDNRQLMKLFQRKLIFMRQE
ncbi:unnamed protein product [Paramecium octaurelia]|uniref:Uncharacterized protein n=1 Tax=Paramecium octaurelia TaxID=43137 RepID=A0A8S1UAF2_PAROT|nr:unnamed protein product [Paramecium octaurelia]